MEGVVEDGEEEGGGVEEVGLEVGVCGVDYSGSGVGA